MGARRLFDLSISSRRLPKDTEPAVVVAKDSAGVSLVMEALADVARGSDEERKESGACRSDSWMPEDTVVVEAAELARGVIVDAPGERLERADGLLPGWETPPASAVSHIFFTSGSTGRPKASAPRPLAGHAGRSGEHTRQHVAVQRGGI